MKIVTQHIYPPIPLRSFDWIAYDEDRYDGAEDGDHTAGFGASEAEARTELYRLMIDTDERFADLADTYTAIRKEYPDVTARVACAVARAVREGESFKETMCLFTGGHDWSSGVDDYTDREIAIYCGRCGACGDS